MILNSPVSDIRDESEWGGDGGGGLREEASIQGRRARLSRYSHKLAFKTPIYKPTPDGQYQTPSRLLRPGGSNVGNASK